jgi:hypothetical protein
MCLDYFAIPPHRGTRRIAPEERRKHHLSSPQSLRSSAGKNVIASHSLPRNHPINRTWIDANERSTQDYQQVAPAKVSRPFQIVFSACSFSPTPFGPRPSFVAPKTSCAIFVRGLAAVHNRPLTPSLITPFSSFHFASFIPPLTCPFSLPANSPITLPLVAPLSNSKTPSSFHPRASYRTT